MRGIVHPRLPADAVAKLLAATLLCVLSIAAVHRVGAHPARAVATFGLAWGYAAVVLTRSLRVPAG